MEKSGTYGMAWAAKLMRATQDRIEPPQGWASPMPVDGESWETWRERASRELLEMSTKSANKSRSLRRWLPLGVRTVWRSAKGLVLGWALSASAVKLLDAGADFPESGWSLEFWFKARDIERLDIEQAAARKDAMAPLPLGEFVAPRAPHPGTSRWRTKAREWGEWALAWPLAPLGWAAALGLQPWLESRAWSMASEGIKRAAVELQTARSESEGVEAWFGACRWIDSVQEGRSGSKLAGLALAASSSGGALGLLREVDAGWRRLGNVVDELGRRRDIEERLEESSMAIALGTALGDALDGPDRKSSARAALGMLARWPDSSRVGAERWRLADLAKKSSSAAYGRAGAMGPWEELAEASKLAWAWCQSDGWSPELGRQVAKGLVSEACMANLARSGDEMWRSGQDAALATVGLWSAEAWSNMPQWKLGISEMATALLEGLNGDERWRDMRSLAMGGSMSNAHEAMERACERGWAIWEARDIAHTLGHATARRGELRL
jgi:hypothetical protein